MNESSGVKIDYTNVMGEAGDAHFICKADLDGIEAKVLAGHDGIESKRASDMIGFHDLPGADISNTLELAEECAKGCEAVVVLGIGGSALGTTAVATALLHPWHNVVSKEDRGGRPRLFVIDNIDSVEFGALLDTLDPKTTLFNVISKSGETAETSTQFLIAVEWLKKTLGDGWTERVVVTAGPDKTSSWQKLVQTLGLRCLPVPPNVGGRFSVLTPVGLFPLAVVGVDVKGLLAGAATMRDRCVVKSLRENPAYTLGTVLHMLEREKNKPMAVLMPYSQALRDMSDWFRQLWAESLGKIDEAGNHVGQTPIKALGVTDQHSQLQLYIEGPNDKVVIFLTADNVERDIEIPESLPITDATGYLVGHTMNGLMVAEKLATEVSLTQAGRPNLTVSVSEISANTIGQLFMLFEVATAMAGERYEIDAFVQDGVERVKIATKAYMGHPDYVEKKKELDEFTRSRERFTV